MDLKEFACLPIDTQNKDPNGAAATRAGRLRNALQS